VWAPLTCWFLQVVIWNGLSEAEVLRGDDTHDGVGALLAFGAAQPSAYARQAQQECGPQLLATCRDHAQAHFVEALLELAVPARALGEAPGSGQGLGLQHLGASEELLAERGLQPDSEVASQIG